MMAGTSKPTAEQIRQARIENPKLRERDLALNLGISELELLAAHCGQGATRLNPAVASILSGLSEVGEVMALTRNDSAVHEKIGVYDKMSGGEHSILFLGDIDLRIFPGVWQHAFAVEKSDDGGIRQSLQFFDKAGDAVHKVHLRPASDVTAYRRLVDAHISDNQSPGAEVVAFEAEDEQPTEATTSELRERWSAMTDVHQFFGILRQLKMSRREAMNMVGQDYAWKLDQTAVTSMMRSAAQAEMPIMCFVGSRGCIQIHSGPIARVEPMGPWINVLDETFHLHLRTDHIHEVWGVRKPSKDGHVTSLEAYDRAGKMVIQFFGKRHEGNVERADWRELVEALPRTAEQSAA